RERDSLSTDQREALQRERDSLSTDQREALQRERDSLSTDQRDALQRERDSLSTDQREALQRERDSLSTDQREALQREGLTKHRPERGSAEREGLTKHRPERGSAEREGLTKHRPERGSSRTCWRGETFDAHEDGRRAGKDPPQFDLWSTRDGGDPEASRGHKGRIRHTGKCSVFPAERGLAVREKLTLITSPSEISENTRQPPSSTTVHKLQRVEVNVYTKKRLCNATGFRQRGDLERLERDSDEEVGRRRVD
ncbi:Reticulocyte-binding protein 2 like a, partial [Dissostichus eleginoides]